MVGKEGWPPSSALRTFAASASTIVSTFTSVAGNTIWMPACLPACLAYVSKVGESYQLWFLQNFIKYTSDPEEILVKTTNCKQQTANQQPRVSCVLSFVSLVQFQFDFARRARFFWICWPCVVINSLPVGNCVFFTKKNI